MPGCVNKNNKSHGANWLLPHNGTNTANHLVGAFLCTTIKLESCLPEWFAYKLLFEILWSLSLFHQTFVWMFGKGNTHTHIHVCKHLRTINFLFLYFHGSCKFLTATWRQSSSPSWCSVRGWDSQKDHQRPWKKKNMVGNFTLTINNQRHRLNI